MKTTTGQILINEALPSDLQDYNRILDKKGLKVLLREIYENAPEHYRETVKKLTEVGADVAFSEGNSLSVASLRPPKEKHEIVKRMRAAADKAYQNNVLGGEEGAQKAMISAMEPFLEELKTTIYAKALEAGNPLAMQIASGARGNAGGLNSLSGADVIYTDSKDQPIPLPVTNSYSEGLSPAEYWAGSYGARKGTVATKLSTAKAGFFGKQISQAAHRLVVTAPDCGTNLGVPVETADKDSIGALMAQGTGAVDRDEALTSRNLMKLKNRGIKEIMVRSPMTCQAKEGVCAKCAGVRDRGRLPDVGDHIGLNAAQAISERLSQGSLASKHSGGVLGAAESVSGFDLINQLIQVPTAFKGGAAVADLDGHVTDITEAPQGGTYINIGQVQHWAPPEMKLKVKVGSVVEAGDVMSEGIPNPARIVAHKGIGEGRRYFTQQFTQAFRDSGMQVDRRNVELVARGLINHVRVIDEDASDVTMPNDLVNYDALVSKYQPRMGSQARKPNMALGRYLEQPALHFSIGTCITPSVVKRLQQHKIGNVITHGDEPSFQPEMHRAMEALTVAPDWQERLGGFYLGRGFQQAVHKGLSSTTESTSYIPRVAQGKPLFGAEEKVKISPVI